VTPQLIRDVEAEAERRQWAPRRYSAGGHVLWLCLPDRKAWDHLDAFLKRIGRAGCAVFSPTNVPGWLGQLSGGVFAEKLRSVFDPVGKFWQPMSGHDARTATA
jgi:hypothetical protein